MSEQLDLSFAAHDDEGRALEGARLLAARDRHGLAEWLLAGLEAQLGRPPTRDERLYCHTSALIAVVGTMAPHVARLRAEEFEEHHRRLAAEQGSDYWRRRYEHDGLVYTLDARRLVDRRPTNPMGMRRGRIVSVRGEWVRVQWFDTRNHPLVEAQAQGWARELTTKDERWSDLTLRGTLAACESDIPGFGCGPCDDAFLFDPTTGVVTNTGELAGSPGRTRVYRPTEPFDVRRFAP